MDDEEIGKRRLANEFECSGKYDERFFRNGPNLKSDEILER